MEAVVYYSLHLVARKNLFVHISYVLATLAFVTFSYQSGKNLSSMLKLIHRFVSIANRLYEIPRKISISIPQSSTSPTRTLKNVSSIYEQRIGLIRSVCQRNHHPAIISEHRKLINHLGFLLRSHSLFYCSVPKVATRTLLNYITYLHIRDEIIPSLTNQSSVYFKDRSSLFNTDFINSMLSSSIQVNIEILVCPEKVSLIVFRMIRSCFYLVFSQLSKPIQVN